MDSNAAISALENIRVPEIAPARIDALQGTGIWNIWIPGKQEASLASLTTTTDSSSFQTIRLDYSNPPCPVATLATVLVTLPSFSP